MSLETPWSPHAVKSGGPNQGVQKLIHRKLRRQLTKSCLASNSAKNCHGDWNLFFETVLVVFVIVMETGLGGVITGAVLDEVEGVKETVAAAATTLCTAGEVVILVRAVTWIVERCVDVVSTGRGNFGIVV